MKGDRKLQYVDRNRRTRKRLRNATIAGKASWDKHSKWLMRRAEAPIDPDQVRKEDEDERV